jgi:L-rhamnose isomerase
VRWDSDHVVLLDDATTAITQEIVRGDAIQRVNIGLDFFDASINRVAAWVVGARNVRKALLQALLEPRAAMLATESRFDGTERLALLEEQKSMPWPAVWEYYCLTRNLPTGIEWLTRVRAYEKEVLSKRSAAQLTPK